MCLKTLILSGTVLSILFAPTVASPADPNVRWADIVGIIQANNVVGSGTGAVTGGGQPWSATRGAARVNLSTGEVHFRVDGLVLAGGSSIGTPGTITEVKGTLVCDADGSASGGNSTLVDTPLVPLTAQGDAEFQGVVAIPGICETQPDIALLVRIGAGRWIANGAVRTP